MFKVLSNVIHTVFVFVLAFLIFGEMFDQFNQGYTADKTRRSDPTTYRVGQ